MLAWNTISQQPETYVQLIEKALDYYLSQDDEELQTIGDVYFNHFEHLFTDQFIKKWKR